MLKRNLVLTLGIVALAALSWSDSAIAKLSANGTSLSGLTSNAATLQAVRIALPDGTELKFR
jgi:hypothetical protein